MVVGRALYKEMIKKLKQISKSIFKKKEKNQVFSEFFLNF